MSASLPRHPNPILVASRVPLLAKAVQEAAAADQALITDHAAATDEELAEVRVAICDTKFMTAEFLARLPNLEWCQATSAGVDVLFDIVPEERRGSFAQTRFGGVFGRLMAEYVVMQMLAIERHAVEYREKQAASRWETYQTSERPECRRLEDTTVAILGCGDIGIEVAAMLKHAFGVTVRGLRTRRPDGYTLDPAVDAMFFQSDDGEGEEGSALREAISTADYVVSVLPNTPQTTDLLSGDLFSACTVEGGAVFINVGRGNVIDEDSILNALDEGWLRHAVLDVFRTEPLPADSPLWLRPDITITPHSSCTTLASDVGSLFGRNLEKVVGGRLDELEFSVDWERGY